MAIDWQCQICNIREERRMRLIDADAFDAIINDDGTIDEYATETARNAMLIMPTVDAVPVIRCKDCKFSKAYYHGSESNLGMFTYLCTQGLCKNADDYCSRAERKDNGESN